MLSDPKTSSEYTEYSLFQALAGSVGASVVLFDRDDRLMFATDDYRRFFPLPDEVFTPGARLRDFLGAVYDSGERFGIKAKSTRDVSRDDWIAERIAIHWRERYESIEQLNDGRWVKLGKRRLPSGIMINYVTDVSNQKRRDRDYVEMRDHAELAQHILDKLPNPVIVKDANLRFILVNNAFCELLEVPAHTIIGRRAGDFLGETVGAKFEESERMVLKTGSPIEFVEDIANSDGTMSRVITRKHRSGMPGSYYITISVDRILTYSTRKKASGSVDQKNGKPGSRRRVLVVDEISARAEKRVAQLSATGVDVMSLEDQHQLIAFLETAKSMNVVIDEVEASPVAGIALAANPLARNYPVLAPFVDKTLHNELSGTVNVDQSGDFLSAKRTKPDSAHHEHEAAEQVMVSNTRASGSQGTANKRSSLTPPTLSFVTTGTEKSIQNGGVSKNQRSREQVSTRNLVLIAEDNEVNQIVFQQILEDIDVNYHLVCNGEEAITAWREMKPDLILMDVSMPVMNGHQATRVIRAEENRDGFASNHVPIIAVTAHALAGDKDECFAAGMDDYMTKPISPEKLISTVSNWISIKYKTDKSGYQRQS